MKNITSDKLRNLQELPTREKVGFNIRSKSWFEDSYKKSSNDFYCMGMSYYKACAKKYEGKPAHQLIRKLRSSYKHKYKHASFKKAIESYINENLLSNNYVDMYLKDNFVNVNNIVTKNPSIKVNDNYSLFISNILKRRDQYLKLEGNIIIRYKGLHYYVTNTLVLLEPFRIYYEFDTIFLH